MENHHSTCFWLYFDHLINLTKLDLAVVYPVIPEVTVAEADPSRSGTFKSFKLFDSILELNQMDLRLHMKIQKGNFSLETSLFQAPFDGLTIYPFTDAEKWLLWNWRSKTIPIIKPSKNRAFCTWMHKFKCQKESLVEYFSVANYNGYETYYFSVFHLE